jgi:hypothetical protein
VVCRWRSFRRGEHPVHDTLTKTYRHLNFSQHECVLEVRTPRVTPPDGTVRLVKPPFAGKLSRFTLLYALPKVEPMTEVAAMVRRHLEGIVAWAQTRQTNGFLEARNGLFQAAQRRARGFASFDTLKTVIFLITGRLDFAAVNPHAR